MPFITERWWLQFFLVRVFERTNGKEIVDTSFDPCQNHVLHTSQKKQLPFSYDRHNTQYSAN